MYVACGPYEKLREVYRCSRRHGEPTARVNARPMTGFAKQSGDPAVIASEAKQSRSSRRRELDCFVASLLAMTAKACLRVPAAPKSRQSQLSALSP